MNCYLIMILLILNFCCANNNDDSYLISEYNRLYHKKIEKIKRLSKDGWYSVPPYELDTSFRLIKGGKDFYIKRNEFYMQLANMYSFEYPNSDFANERVYFKINRLAFSNNMYLEEKYGIKLNFKYFFNSD